MTEIHTYCRGENENAASKSSQRPNYSRNPKGFRYGGIGIGMDSGVLGAGADDTGQALAQKSVYVLAEVATLAGLLSGGL